MASKMNLPEVKPLKLSPKYSKSKDLITTFDEMNPIERAQRDGWKLDDEIVTKRIKKK